MNVVQANDAMFTDRSSIMTYRRCHYRRYLEKHWDGKGITPDAVAVPLATGGAIHLGLQRLLEGASVDEAVQDALSDYRDAVAAAGFQDTRSADQDYTIKEQLALTEVMLRAWALKRLPLVQAQYNVIEVEREAPPTELAPGIWLLRRPDGVLENKITGFYETLSFKTAKQYTSKTDKNNIIDDQGISETWAVAQKYGEHKVGPVLMEFLVTGPRKYATAPEGEVEDALTVGGDDDYEVPLEAVGAPLKYQWNSLIRAWRDNLGNVSWRYKMPDPEDLSKMATMAKFFNPNYRKRPKKGEIFHEYELKSFPVWEEMPIKAWFDMMVMNHVFPTWCDPFERMFKSRKYNRLPYELPEWQREAAAQEKSIKSALRILRDPKYDAATKERVMAEVFPKYRHSCEYPTPCPFKRHCWEGLSDPLSAGFRYRIPNHPEELPSQ